MTPTHRVVFERRARDQLAAIEDWIAARTDRETATRIGDALIARCLALGTFPERGSPRDDVRPGLRTLAHDARYTIGYRVIGDRVVVLGVIGRGQPLDALVGRP